MKLSKFAFIYRSLQFVSKYLCLTYKCNFQSFYKESHHGNQPLCYHNIFGSETVSFIFDCQQKKDANQFS